MLAIWQSSFALRGLLTLKQKILININKFRDGSFIKAQSNRTGCWNMLFFIHLKISKYEMFVK